MVKKLTVEDILDGAKYAVEHPEEYDQRQWYGPPCCVLGHARRLVRSEDRPNGLENGEYDAQTPKEKMIRSMLDWRHQDTAALMPFVQESGVLVVPKTSIGLFGAGAVIERAALIEPNVRIGVGTKIRMLSTIEFRAEIGDHVIIEARVKLGARTRIGNNVRIGYNAKIGCDAVIGDGAVIRGKVVIERGRKIPAGAVVLS